MRLSEHARRVLAEFESVLRDSDPSLVLQFQRSTMSTKRTPRRSRG